MPDYTKGKIYALRSSQTDDIYIGSTCTTLSQRMANHRSDFKRWEEGLGSYISSFHLLSFEDCYIELIEEFPCQNKEQLEQREGHYIRTIQTCCNKNHSKGSRKEYMTWFRENHKEEIREYDRKYREENREKVNENNRLFRLRKRQETIQNKESNNDFVVLSANKESLDEKY